MSKSPKGLQSSSGVKKKNNKETKPKIPCLRDAITLCTKSLILLSLQRGQLHDSKRWHLLTHGWRIQSCTAGVNPQLVNNGRGHSLTCRIMSDEKQKRSVYYKPGRRWPCNQNRSCGRKRKTHCTPSMRPAKAARNSRQDIIPVPGAGRGTTGPGVSADSTAPMGQARSNPPHLVHTSPSPLKNTLTPGGALMRMNRNTLQLLEQCVCMCSVAQLCLTLQPHGLQPIRLLCPWDFPGKNTGVGCHSSSRGSSRPRDRACVSCISCIGRWVL